MSRGDPKGDRFNEELNTGNGDGDHLDLSPKWRSVRARVIGDVEMDRARTESFGDVLTSAQARPLIELEDILHGAASPTAIVGGASLDHSGEIRVSDLVLDDGPTKIDDWLRKGITAEGDVLDLDPIAVGGGGAANHEASSWALAPERCSFDREEEGDTSRHEIGDERGDGGVDERAVLSYGPWARRGLGGVTGGGTGVDYANMQPRDRLR